MEQISTAVHPFLCPSPGAAEEEEKGVSSFLLSFLDEVLCDGLRGLGGTDILLEHSLEVSGTEDRILFQPLRIPAGLSRVFPFRLRVEAFLSDPSSPQQPPLRLSSAALFSSSSSSDFPPLESQSCQEDPRTAWAPERLFSAPTSRSTVRFQQQERSSATASATKDPSAILISTFGCGGGDSDAMDGGPLQTTTVSTAVLDVGLFASQPEASWAAVVFSITPEPSPSSLLPATAAAAAADGMETETAATVRLTFRVRVESLPGGVFLRQLARFLFPTAFPAAVLGCGLVLSALRRRRCLSLPSGPKLLSFFPSTAEILHTVFLLLLCVSLPPAVLLRVFPSPLELKHEMEPSRTSLLLLWRDFRFLDPGHTWTREAELGFHVFGLGLILSGITVFLLLLTAVGLPAKLLSDGIRVFRPAATKKEKKSWSLSGKIFTLCMVSSLVCVFVLASLPLSLSLSHSLGV